MNSIIRYHPWHHVGRAILNSAPLPISILHKKKKVKQPQREPPKKREKKSVRKREPKKEQPKSPIGVIYF